MATIRNLTFRSRDLGDDLSLMLCFTPPGSGLFRDHFPVAWKVTTLGARGGSILNVQYISQLSVCSAQVSGPGNYVTAGTYIPVSPGQMTTLQRTPGGYEWSVPVNNGGIVVRAVNGTNSPVGIGAGFITDEGTNRETMNTAIVYDNVGAGLAVQAEFTPVLSAYISLGYQENQLVTSEIAGLDPLWKNNLLSLQESTTIWIRKTPQGGYIAEVSNFNEAAADLVDGELPDLLRGIDLSFGATRVYRATLSFSNTSMVCNMLQAMMRELLAKGYNVKVVTQNGDKDARIELVLPTNTSCYQAEKAILGSIRITQFPLPVAIKERSGEVMKFAAGHMSRWTDISPASMEWYIAKPGPVDLLPSTDKEAALISNEAALAIGVAA